MNAWTKLEDEKLKQLLLLRKSHEEVARALPGRTVAAVRQRVHVLRLKHTQSLANIAQKWGENASPMPPPISEAWNKAIDMTTFPQATVDPDLPAPEEPESLVAFWKKRAKELERALGAAQESQTAIEVLAEQMHELAPKSYQPAPFSPSCIPPHEGHGSPQSAVLLFSDTHIGAVVKPDQTLGLGNYNREIFLRRLRRLERSVFSILKDHTTTNVLEIVVPMLGDMLDGALIHGAECGQMNTLLSQFYTGGHAIAQFFRNLSAIAPLRVYTTVGNHTRWGHQHKMPTKNRNSNFDALLYLYIQALLRDVSTIALQVDMQPFACFEVQGYPFYCLHGDNVRGGDRMLGIPAHALGRMVSTTNQLFSRAGRETPAYFCLGHLHRPIETPHAKGTVIVNGAFPGIDGFALTEYFNSSWPLQKFFLCHPKFGRSATYDLRLDLGDETPHGYELPAGFEMIA